MTTEMEKPDVRQEATILPGSTLMKLPPGEAIPVHRRDWDRIHRKLNAITHPSRLAANMGWTVLGIGASSILAWLPWQAAYSSLNPNAHYRYAWVGPILLVIPVACVLVAAACFIAAKSQKDTTVAAVTELITDMTEICPPLDDHPVTE